MARRVATLLLMTALLCPARAGASDPVLDWIAVMNDAVLTAGTNGIYKRAETSVWLRRDLRRGQWHRETIRAVGGGQVHRSTRVIASRGGPSGLRDAAEVVLGTIGGTQQSSDFVACGDFLGPGADKDKEIAAGIAYGQFVADTIYMIRSSDGFAPGPPPPFAGIDRVGFCALRLPTPLPWGRSLRP
jgi:hypothetical protein